MLFQIDQRSATYLSRIRPAQEINPARGLFANFESFVASKIGWDAVQEHLRVKSEILLLDVSNNILIKNN